MDAVFRAINDPSRRRLLDELYERDGQTLGELCAHLPEMTRYGVMNHLSVLEEAELVTTQKRGRQKFHYLNPVPIKLVHDRWISRYAELRVGAIADVKARLESGEHHMDTPAHVYKTFIRGSMEAVWDAITNPEKTTQYFYGTAVESNWEVGSELNYRYPDGTLASDGEILAIDPPKKLEFTFRALWDEKLTAEGAAREVWELAESSGMVELKIEIYDIGPETLEDFSEGLPYIVAGLKTLVETGQQLAS
jgi:uncharacterized protein YndB with AHSA1/START domain/DNA-binding transcriptional ArsR family regulator